MTPKREKHCGVVHLDGTAISFAYQAVERKVAIRFHASNVTVVFDERQASIFSLALADTLDQMRKKSEGDE